MNLLRANKIAFAAGTLLFSVLFFHLFFHAHALDWRNAYFNVMDSFYLYRVLLQMLDGANRFVPEVYDVGYGTPYYLLAYAVIKVREFLGYGTDLLDVDTAVRVISFVPAMALLPMYRWLQGRLHLPRFFWLFAWVVTFSIYEFFFYCVFPKPDVLQYVLLLPAFYFLIKMRERKCVFDAMIATSFCALSAGVKMSGVFLFPWVFLVGLVNLIEQDNGKFQVKKVAMWTVKFAIPMGLLFAGIYFLSNPRWIVNFQKNWGYVTATQEKGWAGETVWRWEWFKVAGQLGYFLWASYFGYIAWRLRLLCKNFKWALVTGEDLLAIFPIFFFSYLFFDVLRAYPLRYLFPILPVLLFTTVRFWQNMWLIVVPPAASMKRRWALGAVLALLFVVGDWNRFAPGFRQVKEIAFYETSSRVEMGKYLVANFPKETKIAFFFYTWAPAYFPQARYFMGYDPEIIELLVPDVVLLTDHPRNQDFFKGVEEKTQPFRLAKRMGELVLFEREKM